MLTKRDLTAIDELIEKRVTDSEQRLDNKLTKKLGKKIAKVQHTLDTFIKLSDSTLQQTRRRVSKIENHLHITPAD